MLYGVFVVVFQILVKLFKIVFWSISSVFFYKRSPLRGASIMSFLF